MGSEVQAALTTTRSYLSMKQLEVKRIFSGPNGKAMAELEISERA